MIEKPPVLKSSLDEEGEVHFPTLDEQRDDTYKKTLAAVVEMLRNKGRLFVGIDIDETTPVVYVGCYVTKWGKTDEPTKGFYPLSDDEDWQVLQQLAEGGN